MTTPSKISFHVEGDHFIRNGEQHKILSGALHYFRVHPDYWEDRILKYRACGLNTIETYMPWNAHEPKKGEFDFEGILDLRRFVQIAESCGMDVILRPGPYICAEWELGGLPAWLLAEPDLRLRCMNEPYLAHTESFLNRVMEEIGDLQCTQNGRIIAIQVENEYGSYGNDSKYLEWVESTLKSAGADVLLFTSDGPDDGCLQGGSLPHLLKTVNFGSGSKAKESFETLRKYQPEGPLMCMEFWNGWFDYWGEEHHRRDAKDAADSLDEILKCGASVNIYMMHGGTNFGFLNGANQFEEYSPTVTSYDYDAPLDEQGNPTEKYKLIRDVLARHGGKVEPIPPTRAAKSLGEFSIEESAPLFENLDELGQLTQSTTPPTMEEVGQNYGWIMYRTRISGPRPEAKLFLEDVRDRAHVYLDGKPAGIVHRNDKQEGVPMAIPAEGVQLDVLVENLGRVNYGPKLADRKGILSGIRCDGQLLHHWDVFSLELSDFTQAKWQTPHADGTPSLHKVSIPVTEPCDTFLQIVDGQHGAVWLNGFALGRYWEIGPTKTLYVPAGLLKKGDNELIVFEVESSSVPSVKFLEKPIL